MRLFVAIVLPDAVLRSLLAMQTGVPGARWQSRDQLHLTLRFIGETDGRQIAAIDDALASIHSPPFTLELKGVGSFGGRPPRDIWVGVRASDALLHLQRKIESALQRAGCEPDGRKYTPHVTLARLKGAPNGRVMDFLADHALYASEPFSVDRFALFSSRLTPGGGIYRIEKTYRLL
jgi:2'-5' RNA ligase